VPQVTTDGQGTWVAVWHSLDSLGGAIGTNPDILVARSTDSGATWTPPAALNTNAATDSEHNCAAQVTTDGLGAWVAVWASYDSLGGTIGTDWDILVARSTNNGATWTAPAALNTNAASDVGDDSQPQVTTDEKGTWVATWHSTDSLGDTIGTDRDILVARSTDDGATWTAPAALNTNAASDAESDTNPQLTTDAQGTWVAVWEYEDPL
jgi:Neuraminidase (sialidase)